jgi:hypothetical protein
MKGMCIDSWGVFFAVMAKGAEVLHVAPDGTPPRKG